MPSWRSNAERKKVRVTETEREREREKGKVRGGLETRRSRHARRNYKPIERKTAKTPHCAHTLTSPSRAEQLSHNGPTVELIVGAVPDAALDDRAALGRRDRLVGIMAAENLTWVSEKGDGEEMERQETERGRGRGET